MSNKSKNIKVGDLLCVKSTNSHKIMEYGIFLGMETTWKDWYRVWINGQEYKFDEPYWELEVIGKL